MKVLLLFFLTVSFCFLAFVPAASAGETHIGKITAVQTFTASDEIRWSMEGTHSCGGSAFKITATRGSTESRNAIRSALLAAYLAGKEVKAIYDGTGDFSCDGTYALDVTRIILQ